MKSHEIAALLLVSLLTASGQASAEAGTLEQCQRIKDRIAYYTDKRRAGGSSRQMQAWKDARQANQREFKRYRCYRHGSRLG
jgi:hypothetical protein